ncbi:MAG: hypothetical protein AAFR13_07020 [Pseudomonadota bacterium]
MDWRGEQLVVGIGVEFCLHAGFDLCVDVGIGRGRGLGSGLGSGLGFGVRPDLCLGLSAQPNSDVLAQGLHW